MVGGGGGGVQHYSGKENFVISDGTNSVIFFRASICFVNSDGRKYGIAQSKEATTVTSTLFNLRSSESLRLRLGTRVTGGIKHLLLHRLDTAHHGTNKIINMRQRYPV